MTVRRLGGKDAPVFRAIRRESLIECPKAFVATVDFLDGQDDADLAERLETIPTFVAFDGETPVGVMAYFKESAPALQHRATLINVYVRREARGQGLAVAMLQALIASVRAEGMIQLELGVAVDNTRAIRFYERAGFERVGTIPRGFRHGETFTDEDYMVLRLDA